MNKKRPGQAHLLKQEMLQGDEINDDNNKSLERVQSR